MNWKRIGRALVCLLVVCCLILNMAPVRAQALVLADDIAIGIVALLILMACGVAFAPQTVNDVVAIGSSFQTYMYQWGTSAEKLDEVDEWFRGLVIYNGGSDLDGDGEEDSPHDRQVHLAKGLLTGIAAWVCSVISAGVSYEKEVSYVCSLKLPEWDVAKYPYFHIVTSPTLTLGPTYYLYISDTVCVQRGTYPALNVSAPDLCSKRCTYSTTDKNWQSFGYQSSYWANSESSSNCYEYISYSNYDIYDSSGNLYFEANVSEVKYNTMILTPEALLGDVAPGISEGITSESDLVVPEVIDYSNLVPLGASAQEEVMATSQQMSDGTLEYQAYLDLIMAADSGTEEDATTATDPSSAPDTGADDSTQTVGNTNAATFLDALVDAITAPFEWLAETLLEGIKTIFVPSEDFLTEKVEALRDEFVFADSIIYAGDLVGGTLQSLETSPPVIYIDLGAARGSYYLGGKEAFIDLNWYAEYKPVGDALISALLWIAFIWRLFVKLPGIISGMPGDFVMDGLHQIGLADRLPTRNAAYEVQRIGNRQSLRRGSGK